jgi:hypothetical protein
MGRARDRSSEAEQGPFKPRVVGSNPTGLTKPLRSGVSASSSLQTCPWTHGSGKGHSTVLLHIEMPRRETTMLSNFTERHPDLLFGCVLPLPCHCGWCSRGYWQLLTLVAVDRPFDVLLDRA